MKKRILTILLLALVICAFFALSANAECAEHSYKTEIKLGEYGFLGDIDVVSKCTACSAKTEETIPSIFITRGYSYTDGGIAQGYGIDRDALARFETLTGEKLKFGGVLAVRSVIGDNNPLDNEGNPTHSTVQSIDLTDTEYSIINVMVSGIPDSMRGSEGILCALYINVGGQTTYLDNHSERVTCTDKTFDEVVAEPEFDYVGVSNCVIVDGKKYHEMTAKEFNLINCAFWNSGALQTTDASTGPKFWTNSVALTKSDLPNGTIIEVDADNNWQYRPNKMPGTRPDPVNTKRVVIDDAWWGSYTRVGFNISKNNGTLLNDVKNMPNISTLTADDIMSAFRILVPVDAKKKADIPLPPAPPPDYSTMKQDWDEDGVLKILSIGNSFSVDSLEYVYQVAQDAGIEKVVLGNLYIGGCTLATHLSNATNNSGAYTYYTNTNGTWSSKGGVSIKTAVESDDWDFITMQQASGSSGVGETYADVAKLIDIVEPLNPSARIVWHMTWAYQQNSSHSEFSKYDKNQTTMYNAIISAVKGNILAEDRIELVIPAGTAIQNARTSYVGDTLTRDGYHLSYDLGRYIGSLMFVKSLTGMSIDAVDYAPDGVDETERAMAIEAVNNAYAKPFEVTNSTYTEAPTTPPSGGNEGGEEPEAPQDPVTPQSPFGAIPEGYVALDATDMGLMLNSFYNTTGSSTMNGTDDFAKGFVATKKFTKAQLPVGSIIQVASGWQYRPEGWAYTGSRPNNVTTAEVTVTEDWWGSYIERAFNISKTTHYSGHNDVNTYSTDEIATLVFRILVPEETSQEEAIVYVDSSLCDDTVVTINGKQYRALTADAMGLMRKAYYFSQEMGPKIYSTTDGTSDKFWATKTFTKNDLPTGALLWVASGWQYRPEGWIDENSTNTSNSRPGNVSTTYTTVDDAWWGGFTIRGFNISKTNGSNIVGESVTENDIYSAFKIYIPVENIKEAVQ